MQFQLSYDPAHLYIAGEVEDDAPSVEAALDRLDRIEIHLADAVLGSGDGKPVEAEVLVLTPWSERQTWQWIDASGAARQSASQLSGMRVVGRRLSPTRYAFEAAVPWHHLMTLRPGALRLGFDVVLKDHDPSDAQPSALAFGRRAANGLGGVLTFAGTGPLVAPDTDASLLSGELLADLPYLLVPLTAVLGLVLLLRIWPVVRHRVPWLRPTSIIGGIGLFLIGLSLPALQSGWRDDVQRDGLNRAAGDLQSILSKLEAGTLASYRGPSRDRALTQLLAGEAIARQRYTSYRSLAQMAPEQFGPAYRQFDDLPVRPYWVPLEDGQPESLQFDPPLRGNRLHVVVGRPYTAPFSFAPRQLGAPRLEVVVDYGTAGSRRHEIELDRPFADAAPLGRAHWEACVVPIALERDARALTATIVRGLDFRLVGISVEGQQPGRIEPVMLGTPTRDGVLTDLRGPWPVDAGIELAPGAVAKVSVPRHEEAPQRIWFFYRAIYPGVPTAIPGEKVAEIVLHFAGDRPKRTIVLEHQVSVFYELAFRNTRDVPPEDSPASIAIDWVDESKERHVNLGYPVGDLPADAPIEAIEFRNVAEYRMHFRSVVFVNERAAAPQDPPDSPLLREGQERRLDPRVRQALAGFEVSIYRDGRLSESTLAAAAREEATPLPRAIPASGTTTATLLRDGARRLTAFMPLRGDGWDGAVLGLASTDPDWTAASRSASRWGLALGLCGAPFLLVLLTELLAAATSLRVRLIIVTSLASLAPLGLLSLVLVQVLEGGHVADVDAGVRTTVRSALGQLESQKQKVQASAQQWLAALTRLAATRLAGVKEEQFLTAVAAVSAELEQLLLGQLPPEWHGGFLRLAWQPQLGKVRAAPQAIVVGEARLAIAETPARPDPGIFMQAGNLLIGVRAAAADVGGNFELTAGRPVDGNLVGSLAPGHDVLLTDVRGYPLAASADRPSARQLAEQALNPRAMAARERTLGLGLEQRAVVVERVNTEMGDLVLGSDALRDLQDTPRALLVVAQPDVRATLDLAVGRIPVRAFFLFIAGALVVLSVFLSFVVSERISRPIERLERGAQALSRGQLDTRVQVDDGGQIGALTRAFNQMASDLQARLQDLQALNRTMSELAGEHDESTTVEVLRRFCKVHTAADTVGVALADFTGQRLQYHGADHGVAELPIRKVPLAAMIGPFSSAARDGVLPEPWQALAAGRGSLLGLPIVFGGQTRGFVLLAFDRLRPWPVALDLMSTVVAQAAVAFERCQLQRMAVQDPVTAAFTPEYFRRRIVDEVSLAQQRSQPLVLLATALGDGERRPRGLRRFAALLREQLPPHAVLCHSGNGQFMAVVPGWKRAAAEQCLARIETSWREFARQLPENEVEEQRPHDVVVQFPDEAASAEFLFQALQARVAALKTPGGPAMESDESLQRAGVLSVSPAMRAVYSALRRVAPTDLPLLLEGETGVGKEVLTNLVHRWSRRAGGPLVKVHCAALSETLLASELFGHEKGAFTGADRRKIGRFEQADGGTLFLDEVGDIPLDVQVKLLRVLQEGEIDRVGGSEPVRVDVRVIAATNRDMAQMVQEGRFREDLYYRLQGMVVKVPPLRERKEELPSLVERFRAAIVADGHATARSWSTDALDAMFRHHWPGNIRQLRNTVFRAMVMARGDVVQLRDVQAALAASGPTGMEAAGGEGSSVGCDVVADGIGSAASGRAALPLPEPRLPGPGIEEPPGLGDATPARADSLPIDVNPADKPVLLPAAPADPANRAELPSRPDEGPGAQPGRPAVPASRVELPPRLEALRQRVLALGRYSTQDHMREGSVSHRTALRDLQALVAAGYLERVGSRRGAYYRPRQVGGRIATILADS